MRRINAALALVAAAVVGLSLVLLPVPAQANTRTFPDARHDTRNSNNVLRYRVINGKRIAMTTFHRNLTRKAVDIQFEIDTPRKGRNFHVYAFANGKYTLVYRGTRTFKCKGLRIKRNLRKDILKLSVPRGCVGRPKGKIRVRGRVQWSKNGAKGDWLPSKKGYSPWVRR